MAGKSKVKSSKRAVSDEDREIIITKCLERCSIKTISVVLSLNYHTVCCIVSKFLKYENADGKKTSGNKKPILTPGLKEALLGKVNADCTKTLKKLKEWLKSEAQRRSIHQHIQKNAEKLPPQSEKYYDCLRKRNCNTTLKKRYRYARLQDIGGKCGRKKTKYF